MLTKERKVSTMCQPTTTITAKVEELMNLRKAAEGLQNQTETIRMIFFSLVMLYVCSFR